MIKDQTAYPCTRFKQELPCRCFDFLSILQLYFHDSPEPLGLRVQFFFWMSPTLLLSLILH
jgi:hypothetical protein